jgi:hypothetical protein
MNRLVRVWIWALKYRLRGGVVIAAALALAIGFSVEVSAQTTSAAITGYVVDQNNGAVPNAQIKQQE